MSDNVTAITTTTRTLADLEQVIERGIKTFVEVGGALLEVRDRQLHREAGYERFEDYCKERWGLKHSRAYQLMDAAKVVGLLATSTIVELPSNEAQARELAPLLREDEQQVINVWRELREKHGDSLTADQVRYAVKAGHRLTRRIADFEQRRADRILEALWGSPASILKKTRYRVRIATTRDQCRRKDVEIAVLDAETLRWELDRKEYWEVLAVPGAAELLQRRRQRVQRLLDDIRDLAEEASADLEEIAIELRSLSADAPTKPIPSGGHTPEIRWHLLCGNFRQKNLRGYCGEPGCWKETTARGVCVDHGGEADT